MWVGQKYNNNTFTLHNPSTSSGPDGPLCREKCAIRQNSQCGWINLHNVSVIIISNYIQRGISYCPNLTAFDVLLHTPLRRVFILGRK